ncbi:MAG: hypothetical protein ACFB6R_11550 [Alphaproteobacteria bacterium]
MTQTPIRAIIAEDSDLSAEIQNGIQAVKRSDRQKLDREVSRSFADSLDLDGTFQSTDPDDRRWDYLIGHKTSGKVIAVEIHDANENQVDAVIAKRRAAESHLRDHLIEGARISKWLWVATGRVKLPTNTGKALRLKNAGIEFVGGALLPKHLPQ